MQLDFERVHEMMMQLEEQTYRIWRARERTIKNDTNLSDEVFWQYRNELLRLYDTFKLYDADHSGFLSHEETKQLLKHIGLQPYAPQMITIVESFLCDADIDGNQEINFDEFLKLMCIIRAHQQSLREKALLHEFDKSDLS